MKVLLDTNVLLAAFGTRGLCEALLSACLDAHEIVLADHILAELERNLARKFKLPRKRVAEILSFLRARATLVEPAPVPPDACRDPSDLPVLGAAVAAGVDCLVTGDPDLLTLGSFRSVPILSPRKFYDRLTRRTP